MPFIESGESSTVGAIETFGAAKKTPSAADSQLQRLYGFDGAPPKSAPANANLLPSDLDSEVRYGQIRANGACDACLSHEGAAGKTFGRMAGKAGNQDKYHDGCENLGVSKD